MDNTFAKRFRDERKRLGLTQQELADKLGISKRTITNWETGQTKPFLDRMVMEGMDVGYLISGIPSPPECLQMMRQSVGHGKKTDYLSKDLRILAIKEYCLIIISHLEDID